MLSRWVSLCAYRISPKTYGDEMKWNEEVYDYMQFYASML